MFVSPRIAAKILRHEIEKNLKKSVSWFQIVLEIKSRKTGFNVFDGEKWTMYPYNNDKFFDAVTEILKSKIPKDCAVEIIMVDVKNEDITAYLFYKKNDQKIKQIIKL